MTAMYRGSMDASRDIQKTEHAKCTICIYIYIYIHSGRKLRSQTSDNMYRWKSRGRKNQRREEKRREEEKRRKKIREEKESEERRCRCAKR